MSSNSIDTRWLFVKTCQDLLSKSKSPDYYDKLRMASLLKHLLVGPRALARAVNQEPELPLEFWYREPTLESATEWESPNGFDASRREVASGVVVKASLEHLLAARVVHLQEWFTVEQLLTCVAHVYGGAYAEVPSGLSDEAFGAFDVAAREGAAGVISVALQEVTGVVLRGLIPLANPSGKAPTKPAQRAATSPQVMAPAGSGCPFSGKLSQG